jgi:hypothetical protein
VLRIAVVVGTLAACKTHWRADGAQPELYLGTDPLTRTSTPLAIPLHDMNLPSFVRLNNTAHFVVVTKDRIRVRVNLVHRWESMTEIHRWKAWLEDETGAVVYPVAVEPSRARPIYEIVYSPPMQQNAPFVYRIPVNLWSGGGDYVFYRHGLYRRDLQRLALVMQRRGYEFRYTWHFVDSDTGEPIQSEAAQPVSARIVRVGQGSHAGTAVALGERAQ